MKKYFLIIFFALLFWPTKSLAVCPNSQCHQGSYQGIRFDYPQDKSRFTYDANTQTLRFSGWNAQGSNGYCFEQNDLDCTLIEAYPFFRIIGASPNPAPGTKKWTTADFAALGNHQDYGNNSIYSPSSIYPGSPALTWSPECGNQTFLQTDLAIQFTDLVPGQTYQATMGYVFDHNSYPAGCLQDNLLTISFVAGEPQHDEPIPPQPTNYQRIFTNETWNYDLLGGTWNQDNGATKPSARAAMSMVWDEQNGQAIMFGGVGNQNSVTNDTWTYQAGSGWEQESPHTSPSARISAAMAWNKQKNMAFMFGGGFNYLALNDMNWYDPDFYDADNGEWNPPLDDLPSNLQPVVTDVDCNEVTIKFDTTNFAGQTFAVKLYEENGQTKYVQSTQTNGKYDIGNNPVYRSSTEWNNGASNPIVEMTIGGLTQDMNYLISISHKQGSIEYPYGPNNDNPPAIPTCGGIRPDEDPELPDKNITFLDTNCHDVVVRFETTGFDNSTQYSIKFTRQDNSQVAYIQDTQVAGGYPLGASQKYNAWSSSKIILGGKTYIKIKVNGLAKGKTYTVNIDKKSNNQTENYYNPATISSLSSGCTYTGCSVDVTDAYVTANTNIPILWPAGSMVCVRANTPTLPTLNNVTIQEDVIVKYFTNRKIKYNNIQANGLSDGKIIFTSAKDDDTGGDTNGDGKTAYQAGDWQGITFGGKANKLNYVTIQYATDALYVTQSTGVTLQDSMIKSNSGSAVLMNFDNGVSTGQYDGGDYDNQLCNKTTNPPEINFSGNNVIEDNGLNAAKLYTSCYHVCENSRNFVRRCIPGPSGHIGTYELQLDGSLNIHNDISYYIANPLNLLSGTLSIEAGTVVKLANSNQGGGWTSYDTPNGLISIKGRLEVNGTSDKPVYFTSIYDNATGGKIYKDKYTVTTLDTPVHWWTVNGNTSQESLGDKFVTVGPDTWANTQAQCQSLGGNLTSIANFEENTRIANVLQGIVGWLGFNDINQEGQYKWVDNYSGTFTNWDTNQSEPNGGTGENCTIMSGVDYFGQWYTTGCNTSRMGVCRIPNAQPTVKDWKKIEITGANASFSINNMEIKYAATGLDINNTGYFSENNNANNLKINNTYTGLSTLLSGFQLDNLTLTDNHDGLYVRQSKMVLSDATIKDNTGDAIQLDYNAGQPINLSPSTGEEYCYSNTNPPDVKLNGNNVVENNGLDGFLVFSSCSNHRHTNTGWIYGGEPISRYIANHESILAANQKWYNTIPYYLAHPLIVETGNTLSLEAGTIIKVADDTQHWGEEQVGYPSTKNGQIQILGDLQVTGTSEQKVTITSINDETVGDSLYQEGNMYNYLRIKPTNWSNANTTCKNNGGELVSIHDAHDLDMIKGLAGRNFWVGLTGTRSLYNWSWTDGTPFDYAPWYTSYYSYNDNNANCGLITSFKNNDSTQYLYQLANGNCWESKEALCRIPRTRKSPAERDWVKLNVQGGMIDANHLTIKYAETALEIKDQGYNSSNSLKNYIAQYNINALNVINTNLQYSNGLIENNHDGIHVQQTKINYSNGVIRNNTGDAIQLDYNAGQPVHITPSVGEEYCYSNTTPPDVQFSGNNIFTNNGLDGLKVYSSCASRRHSDTGWIYGGEPIARYIASHESILAADQQWYKDAPYYIAHPFIVESGNTLLLNAGTTIKLADDTQYWGEDQANYPSAKNGQIQILGNLQVNGTSSQKATVTSINDESVGGSLYKEDNLYTYLRILPTNWSNARSICQSKGGDLLSIHNENDLNMVKGLGGRNFWVGYSGSPATNTWTWSDGTAFDYAPWNPSYPRNDNNATCGRVYSEMAYSNTQNITGFANGYCWESKEAICKIPRVRKSPDNNDVPGIEIKGTSSSFDLNHLQIKYADKGLNVHDQGYTNTIGSKLNNFSAINNNIGVNAYQTAFDIYNSVFDGNQDGLYVQLSKINSSGNTWRNQISDSIKLDFNAGYTEPNMADNWDACVNNSTPPEVNFSGNNNFNNNGLNGLKVFSSCMGEERNSWYYHTPYGYPRNGDESNIYNGYLFISRYESRSIANTHWYNTAPYYIANPFIQASGTLTLDPGTIIKMSANTQDWFNPLVSSPSIMHEKEGQMMILGNLQSLGTSANPITFTSIRDNTVAGHTDSTKSYLFKSSATQNWSSSQAACQAMGGELASVRNIDEQIEAQKLCGPNNNCWIGYKYNSTFNNWDWVNGDDTSYYNASYLSTGTDQCTAINTRYSGWRSDYCGHGRYAICRRTTGIEFNSAGPQKEDWGDVQIGRKYDVGNGQTNIKYTDFRYGGGGDANAPDDHLLSFFGASANTSEVSNSNFNFTNRGILINNSGVKIHHNSISSSSDYGVVFDNPLGGNSTIFENNTIDNFDTGIWLKNISSGINIRKNNINANINGVLGNNITANGATLRNNTIDAGTYFIRNQSTPYQTGSGGTTIDAFNNKWGSYPVSDYPPGQMYKNPGNILYGNYSVTLTIPNNNQSWLSKSTHNITWDADNAGGNSRYADLSYSQDDGSTWQIIATNIDFQGALTLHGDYTWTLPELTAETVLVKVDIKDIANTLLASDTNSFSATGGNGTLTDQITNTKPAVGSIHTLTYTNALPYTISSGSLKLTMNDFNLNSITENDLTIAGAGVSWNNSKTINPTTHTILFTFTGDLNSESGVITMRLGNNTHQITNPINSGLYPVSINTYNNLTGTGSYLDTASTNLTITDNLMLKLNASVPAFLDFRIDGLERDQTLNGTTTNVATTATAIAFGTLGSGEQKIAGQKLTVSTNSSKGYQVIVKYSQPLTGPSATVEDFAGTNSDPQAWHKPTGPRAFFGYTTTNGNLKTNNSSNAHRFTSNGGNKWAGLSTLNQSVAESNGPVWQEQTKVGYRLDLSDTFAFDGMYETEIYYICTPTY